MNYPPSLVSRRAINTYAVMLVIDDWTWEEMDAASFKAKCNALGINVESGVESRGVERFSRGDRDVKLKLLAERMSIGIQLARLKFRKDAEKSAALRLLKPGVRTMAGVLAQALAWEKAWAEVDASYVPEAGNTLAAFQLLREQCVEAFEAVAAAQAAERISAGARRKALAELWQLCVDWYAEATIRFPADSPHGITIRRTIPTLTRKRKVKEPAQ
jgi:hypothetical protein